VGPASSGKLRRLYLLRSHLSQRSPPLCAGGAQLSSTFQMMAGSAVSAPPNSICEWSAFAPWKTGAGLCAPRTTLHRFHRPLRRIFQPLLPDVAPPSIFRPTFAPTRPFTLARDWSLGSASSFPYSSSHNFSKGKLTPVSNGRFTSKKYDLEDLQHRYEGLKQRISPVRSYL